MTFHDLGRALEKKFFVTAISLSKKVCPAFEIVKLELGIGRGIYYGWFFRFYCGLGWDQKTFKVKYVIMSKCKLCIIIHCAKS